MSFSHQAKVKYNRETQTYETKTRAIQSQRECGTQVTKNGNEARTSDRLVIPGPYFSSADMIALKLEKVVIIQSHLRGMFSRRLTARLRRERDQRIEFFEKEAKRRELETELRLKREIERRMYPRTHADFRLLYNELEAWRVSETIKIQRSDLSPAEKQNGLKHLLERETKLLQTIDRLKLHAHKQNNGARVKSVLEALLVVQMSRPKVWAQSDGDTTIVHTPFTTRAKELMDLYNGLKLPLLSVDERLDVLLHVKWTVKEFDCNLTREIVDLIDREADMLNRGRPEKSLSGLRTRLTNLFLQFVKTPTFNPEATRFQKLPQKAVSYEPVELGVETE